MWKLLEGREVEPGLGEEALEEAGLVLHPPEPGPDQRGQLIDILFDQVGQRPFQVGPDRLHRVQLRRVSRQLEDRQPVPVRDQLAHRPARVSVQPIPDQDERAVQLLVRGVQEPGVVRLGEPLALIAPPGAVRDVLACAGSNCQDLWMKIIRRLPARLLSSGRSTSLPLTKVARPGPGRRAGVRSRRASGLGLTR